MKPTFIIFQALETAINTFFRFDPHAKKTLEPLVGKTLQLSIKKIDLTAYFIFQSRQILIQSECIGSPDLVIKAKPSQLLRMFTSKDADSILHEDDIEITGDVVLAQKIQQCFKDINIDWPYYVSLLLGDSAANEAERFAKANFQRLKDGLKSLKENVAEFLQEESRLSVSKKRFDIFHYDVSQLRNDVERCESKLKSAINDKKTRDSTS